MTDSIFDSVHGFKTADPAWSDKIQTCFNEFLYGYVSPLALQTAFRPNESRSIVTSQPTTNSLKFWFCFWEVFILAWTLQKVIWPLAKTTLWVFEHSLWPKTSALKPFCEKIIPFNLLIQDPSSSGAIMKLILNNQKCRRIHRTTLYSWWRWKSIFKDDTYKCDFLKINLCSLFFRKPFCQITVQIQSFRGTNLLSINRCPYWWGRAVILFWHVTTVLECDWSML